MAFPDKENGGRVLIKCKDLEHAFEVHRALKMLGINGVSYEATTGGKE